MNNNGYLEQSIARNGIRYFVDENHAFPVVSLGVFVRSGSRYENETNFGIAHFVEHLMFGGTRKRAAFDISHEIEQVGGEINGYTSIEYSYFYVKLLPRDIEIGFDILSDMFINSIFKQDLLEKERQVIIEEMQEDYDRPQDVCEFEIPRSIWGKDAIANNVLGVEETVRSIKQNDLLAFFTKFFNKDNIFISISGDIDTLKAERLVEHYFEAFNANSFVPLVSTPEYDFQERHIQEDKENAQVSFALTFKGSKLFGKDDIMNSICATILGGNHSSRLYQKVREENGLAYDINAYPLQMIDTGATVISTSITPKNLGKVEALIRKELEAVRKKGFTQSEFTDAKNYMTGELILELESSLTRMEKNGQQGLFLGKIQTIDNFMQELNAINFDEFSDYTRNIFDSDVGKVLVGKV